MSAQDQAITAALLSWYAASKRNLPWRRTSDPYRVWVSEIMLQQTRVQTVLDYYDRFLDRFPDVETLAGATQDEVLKAWEGLGYYRRAMNLHKAAKVIAEDFQGTLPNDIKSLGKLPGFGDYTASAVASIAFGERTAPVDGNIVRVISRLFCVETDGKSQKDKRRIKEIAEALLPEDSKEVGNFVQALMELGALVCLPLNPKCDACPLTNQCRSKKEGRQSLFPLKAKRAALPVVHLKVAVICRNDKILMVKRDPNGLLASMWGFPLFEGNLASEIAERFRIEARSIRKRFETTHTFTHLKWQMEIFECEAETLPCDNQLNWFSPEEVERLALPTVFRRIWNRWLSERM